MKLTDEQLSKWREAGEIAASVAHDQNRDLTTPDPTSDELTALALDVPGWDELSPEEQEELEEQATDAYREGWESYTSQPEDGWYADDGNAEVHFEWAESAREAADAYVEDGEWGDRRETWWIDVHVWREDIAGREIAGTRDCLTVEIPAEEPDCIDGAEHSWRDDGTPGFGDVVSSHGGGVILRRACRRCGLRCVTDTWAQRRDTGEQGLTSTRYEEGEPDEAMQPDEVRS